MGLSWTAVLGGSYEVHKAPVQGSGLTPCCNLSLDELPHGDKVTLVDSEVTCPVSWSGRAISSRLVIDHEPLKELEGSVERLLAIRARIVRASSSEINSALREELLRLLDEGE